MSTTPTQISTIHLFLSFFRETDAAIRKSRGGIHTITTIASDIRFRKGRDLVCSRSDVFGEAWDRNSILCPLERIDRQIPFPLELFSSSFRVWVWV